MRVTNRMLPFIPSTFAAWWRPESVARSARLFRLHQAFRRPGSCQSLLAIRDHLAVRFFHSTVERAAVEVARAVVLEGAAGVLEVGAAVRAAAPVVERVVAKAVRAAA